MNAYLFESEPIRGYAVTNPEGKAGKQWGPIQKTPSLCNADPNIGNGNGSVADPLPLYYTDRGTSHVVTFYISIRLYLTKYETDEHSLVREKDSGKMKYLVQRLASLRY